MELSDKEQALVIRQRVESAAALGQALENRNESWAASRIAELRAKGEAALVCIQWSKNKGERQFEVLVRRGDHRLERMPAKQEKPALTWAFQAGLTGVLEASGKTLALQIIGTGKRWAVIAIETAGTDATSILDSHAHKVLGDFSSIPEAIGVSEAYALKWSAGERLEECACEDIQEASGG